VTDRITGRVPLGWFTRLVLLSALTGILALTVPFTLLALVTGSSSAMGEKTVTLVNLALVVLLIGITTAGTAGILTIFVLIGAAVLRWCGAGATRLPETFQ